MNLPASNIPNMTVSLIREYKTPREKVFEAWTAPEALKQWFGPTDVTTTDAQVDLRIGGNYQFAIH